MTYSKTGRARGMQHPASKLTLEDVVAIFQSGEKQLWLAARYKVNESTIGRIQQRKTWWWLTQHITRPRRLHAQRKGTND